MRKKTKEPAGKGSLILGIIAWIKENYGEQGLAELIARLPDEDRAIVENKIYPITRVPASVFKSIFDATAQLWGDGNRAHVAKMGAKIAFEHLGTALKVFLKIGSPDFIIQRFPGVWGHYFTAGGLDILHHEDGRAEILAEGTEPFGWGICEGIEGWARSALEYSGAKNVQVDHSECKFKGGSRCVFKFAFE